MFREILYVRSKQSQYVSYCNTHTYLLYSAPLNRFRGFLQTLHSTKKKYGVISGSTRSCFNIVSGRHVPETLGLGSASPFTEENKPVVELLSTPPRRGRRWLTETCSINEVPYLRKYHHSNICNRKDS